MREHGYSYLFILRDRAGKRHMRTSNHDNTPQALSSHPVYDATPSNYPKSQDNLIIISET